MDVHAEYFLKCPEAASWLNTPQPVTGVPKEFLDGAYSLTSAVPSLRTVTIAADGTVRRRRSDLRKHQPSSSNTASQHQQHNNHIPALPKKSRRNSSNNSANGTPVDRDVRGLDRGFPSLRDLAGGKSIGHKSLLYVPVQLHDHFVFGVVIGTPVPPPEGVKAREWKPLVTRFVLDAGRKCCLMFSYFAEGSIVVLVDCFDEVGDHFQEITIFEPTPVVGVFPRGIRGRMQIFEKRDCPKCTQQAKSCTCPVNDRVEAIVKQRQQRVGHRSQGPAHVGSWYKDDNVTIQTYPYWAQLLDDYKWSRIGSYCVQIIYTPAVRRGVQAPGAPQPSARTLAFRVAVAAEPRPIIDKMLRVALFDKGVAALKPPTSDVFWESSSTISVNSKNEVTSSSDSVESVCFTDWHKLPGFREDYLLVAPSNIVSGAHVHAELARAETERLAANASSSVPVLPAWASGRAGVLRHIITGCGTELEAEAMTQDPTALNGQCESIINSPLGPFKIEAVSPVGPTPNSSPRVSLEDESGRPQAEEAFNESQRRQHSSFSATVSETTS